MGATGTGKSCLSIDLPTQFRGELINSDKMQVYKRLDIVTNKISHAEKQGVRHYLLELSVLNRRVDTRVDEMVNVAKMNTFINNNNNLNKKKVVFIMEATGTGKYHLYVDLATHFRGEIINSEKVQVYMGLGIVTNKITNAEKQGVRHYLLGEIEPDSDFTTEDIYLKSIVYIENILKTQCVPIIVGESNSYIEKLVEDPVFMFKYKSDCFFI
uniref:Isopentenyltransferase n=1 Tax=Solanum tuberosum TaxID=4113 RepID=M1DPH4_SOLTU